MTNPMTAPEADLPAGPSVEDVIAVSRREIFWHPRYLDRSGYLRFLPFLFWLAGDLRPGRAVTLGADSAVAHFALCQASDRLELNAECIGLDTWPGAAEGRPVDAAVARHAAREYPEISRLAPLREDAPDAFAEGSIDLLVIDCAPTARVVEQIGARWMDRLAPGGCVVLRGTEGFGAPAGLRAALDALCEGRASVRLTYGDGLCLVGRGQDLPLRLGRLRELSRDPALFRSMQFVFQRMGAACLHEWEAAQAREPAARGGGGDDAVAVAGTGRDAGHAGPAPSRGAGPATDADPGAIHSLEAAIAATGMLDRMERARVEGETALSEQLSEREAELAALRERLERAEARLRARPVAPDAVSGAGDAQRIVAVMARTARVLAAAEAEADELNQALVRCRNDRDSLRADLEAAQRQLGEMRAAAAAKPARRKAPSA